MLIFLKIWKATSIMSFTQFTRNMGCEALMLDPAELRFFLEEAYITCVNKFWVCFIYLILTSTSIESVTVESADINISYGQIIIFVKDPFLIIRKSQV